MDTYESAALGRLIEAACALLSSSSFPTQALVHIPQYLSAFLTNSLNNGCDTPPDRLALYTAGANTEIQRVEFGPLALTDPLREELLIIITSRPFSAMIAASAEVPIISRAPQVIPWKGVFTFNHIEIAESCTHLWDHFSNHEEFSELAAWLKGFNGADSTGAETELDQPPLWESLLLNLTRSTRDWQRESEEELNWYQTITSIQDAVGWELDIDRLYRSVAQVLDETIGFDYLELQQISNTSGKWEITATFHQNKTDYGGRLLTLILKPDRQQEVLTELKPILVKSHTADKFFTNARLVNFMILESGIVTPLVHKGQPNGLLTLFSCSHDKFTKKDIGRMEAIGRIVGRSLENVSNYNTMRRMAMVDALTNVYNRRFFSDHIIREFNRARRYKTKLGLIMLDIDHFKHYNDTNGHLAGDRVLSEVAAILRANVRESDVVARYGGEEFVIILPEADIKKGLVVAEKIRQAVETCNFPFGEKQPGGRVTISLGLASDTEDVESTNDFINRADIALYQAKTSGRNRVITFSE
ncbi:MAG: diguanylate cyclase [Calditrichota bacterium]